MSDGWNQIVCILYKLASLLRNMHMWFFHVFSWLNCSFLFRVKYYCIFDMYQVLFFPFEDKVQLIWFQVLVVNKAEEISQNQNKYQKGTNRKEEKKQLYCIFQTLFSKNSGFQINTVTWQLFSDYISIYNFWLNWALPCDRFWIWRHISFVTFRKKKNTKYQISWKFKQQIDLGWKDSICQ